MRRRGNKFEESNKKPYEEFEVEEPVDPDLANARLMEKLSHYPEYDSNRLFNMQTPDPQKFAEMSERLDKQRAETLNRMKMWNKSAEILDLIKKRLAAGENEGHF